MQAQLVRRQLHSAPLWEPMHAAPTADTAATATPSTAYRDEAPGATDQDQATDARAESASTPKQLGHSIGRIAIFSPSANGGDQPVQRAPDPAGTATGSGGDAPPPGGDGAVPLDAAKTSNGSTTIQDPPTMQSTTVHGTTLAAVANALGDEAGSVEFDFSVATQGDPATAATLNVTQTLTLPRWAERDKASAAAQRSWDRFLSALTQHENGHLAIDKQMFANAHQRFVGNTAAQVEQTSSKLRAEVQAKQDAFDTQTDHGRSGNPPTTLDTSPDADAGTAPKSTTATDDQRVSDTDASTDPNAGAGPPALQARLFIGPADDPYEREANAVADQVTRANEVEQPVLWNIGRAPRQAQRLCAQCAKALEEGEGELCPECAAKAGQDERVSRKEADETPRPDAHHVPSVVTDTLRTGGEPLDRETRTDMEGRFGHDFSRVRIFADNHAAESARAINAQAYTVGEQVVFGAGHYAPQSDSGRWLLAHELTHVVQQRGETIAPMRAGGLAIQRDEDKKEDFDTEQRRLIRDAKTVGDVKDINPQAFHLASDDDRFRLIGILLNQGWVGPRDEYYLEHIWGSFGKNLQTAAHQGFALWNQCIERGANLWDLAELGPLKDKFRADVAAKTREYLVKNREFVQKEQKRLGLDNPQAPPTADQNKALTDLKDVAKQVNDAEQKQAAYKHLTVGYDPITNVGDDPGISRDPKQQWDPKEFDPDHPPKHSGPVGFEDRPIPTWEATNTEYQKLESLIKGFANKYPSIYALRRDQKVGDVATNPNGPNAADDAKTRQTIATSLQGVLDNIATTDGKLADPKSTLPLELHPIHEQLYKTTWNEQFLQAVAKETIKGYENAKWWEEMGVNALQLALFAVAELATGGAAVFFLALGAGVGVVRAEQSWEAFQEKNAAAKSNVSDETKLLESGEADAALLTAILDTATAFLDLYSVGSAAVREAQGVKSLEEKLAAAEAKEAAGAAETELKQKEEFQFQDSVTGEMHTGHATPEGLTVCSDPPCLIAPQRMRERFNKLPGTPDAETKKTLEGLIKNAEENSTKWKDAKIEADKVTAKYDKMKADQGGTLTARQRLDYAQELKPIEQRMGTLQDNTKQLEDGFGAMAREHQVRNGIENTEKMNFSLGRSDVDVRAKLKMGPDEACADILANDGKGDWIISESKGDEIDKALKQMDNTDKHLREAAKTDTTIGPINKVEYRIYPSQQAYTKLQSTEGLGLSQYRVAEDGYLIQNNVRVKSDRGFEVKILPPPGG